jgi:hypothetical protein
MATNESPRLSLLIKPRSAFFNSTAARRMSNPARRLLLTRPALTASIGAESVSLQVFSLRESSRLTSHSRHCGSSLKRTEREGPPIAQRAFSKET